MEKLYEFKPQDALGKVGEKMFAETNAEFGPVKQEDKSWIDFILTRIPPWTTSNKVEVKTDEMSEKTWNIFVEQYVVKNKPYDGGPWRAQKSDANYVHFAKCNDTFYWFKPEQLIDFIGRAGLRCITGAPNKDGSYAIGYLIPVERLEKLEKDVLLHKQVYDKRRKTDSNPRTT